MKKSLILLSLVAASSLFAEVVYVHNSGSNAPLEDYQYSGQKKAILVKEADNSYKRVVTPAKPVEITVPENKPEVVTNGATEAQPMVKVIEEKPKVVAKPKPVVKKEEDRHLIANEVKPKTAAAVKLVAKMDADRLTCKELKCIHDPSDSNTIARYNTGVSATLAFDDKLFKYATIYTNNIAKAQKERDKITSKFSGYYDLEMVSRKVLSSSKDKTVIDGVFKVVNNAKKGTINVKATLTKKWDRIGLRDVVISDIDVNDVRVK